MPASNPTTMVDLSTAQGVVDALLNHAVTLADANGVADDDLESLYAVAYGHLADGRAADALDDLLRLVMLDPWDSRFQFAYGLALQLLEQYEAAAQHHAQALLMDATNAGIALRIGECLEAQGELHDAADAMRACIALSWSDPQWHLARAHAETALARIDASGGQA